MRLKGIIARVLAIILSVQLAVTPVLAGAQSINLKAQGNLEGAKEAATKAKDAIAATDKVAQTGAKATKTFNILGDQPWGEAFQTGLFGPNLTLAHVFEGALDGAITSGLSSAVYGTNFADGFKNSLVKNVVALGLADAQIGIGTVFNKKDADGNLVNGGEGSLPHILLHGAAGCAAAELTGARCAAGAGAAIAQVFYASSLDPEDALAREAYHTDVATLIGALVGFAASGGEAENVSAGANIAESGFENNYLTHAERDRFLQALARCDGAQACVEEQGVLYLSLSMANNEELLEAIETNDLDKIARIRAQIPTDMLEYQDVVLSALQNDPAARALFAEVINAGSNFDYNGYTITPREAAFHALRDAFADDPFALAALTVDEIGPAIAAPNLAALLGARGFARVGNLSVVRDTGGRYRFERINIHDWKVPETVIKRIPESWGSGNPNRKSTGTRWQDPGNKGNNVRIDQGNPNSSFPSQRVDHVVISNNGKVIGRDGKPIQGSIKDNATQAHIPLSEYQNWSTWHSP